MKNKLFFILLFAINFVTAQSLFIKEYFGVGAETTYSVINENNFIYSTGSTSTFGNGQSDALLIKQTIDGNILWTKAYGGYNNEGIRKIRLLQDGNLLIVGFTTSFSNYTNNDSNMFVIKADTSGAIIWTKSFGGPNSESAIDFIENDDKTLIILGNTTSIGAGANDVLLLKLDYSGNYLWSKSLGSNDNDISTSLTTYQAKGFIISGHTKSFNFDGYYPFVLTVDTLGDFTWLKTYQTTGLSPVECFGNSIIKGFYDNYILIGKKGKGMIGDSQPFVIDLDTLGNYNWGKIYSINSGDCFATNIIKTNDNNFLISGAMGNHYPLLLKINPIGQPLWSYYYGNNFSIQGYLFQSIITSGNSYVSAGYSKSTGDTKSLLIKTNLNGVVASCNTMPFGGAASSIFQPTITSRTFTSTSTNFTLIDTCSFVVGNLSTTTSCLVTSVIDTVIKEESNLTPVGFRKIVFFHRKRW